VNVTRNKGFTLIELMIAIAILALLISVALPGYQDFAREARRSDARHLLYMNASRLQRCFTLEGIYNGSCVTRPVSDEGHYLLNSTIGATSFTLTAVPAADSAQTEDLECTSFVVTNTGFRTATGTTADDCW
jgi:type IV pilus assembly protein PilE